jgi:hypothetical protein
VSPHFFAVNRETLEEIGDLTVLSTLPGPQLLENLARNAHDRGRHVLVTPFAVATFEDSAFPDPEEAYTPASPHPIRANPNLAEFEDASAIAESFPVEL